MQGVLSDGTVIAVKQLSSKSKQGNREFVNEIGMISALQHPHLVKLHGCCIEGNQLLLVYEYMENNSLARALFGKFKEHNLIDFKLLALRCFHTCKGMHACMGRDKILTLYLASLLILSATKTYLTSNNIRKKTEKEPSTIRFKSFE